MIQSMTGFASKIFVLSHDERNKTNITMSLKTLNSRFFEANCKLPHALSALETAFIKILKKKLRRGSIYLTLYMENPNFFKGTVEPALETVESYLSAIEKIKQTCNLSGEVSIRDLISLPYVFSSSEPTLTDEIKAKIDSALEEVITHVIQARTKEGESLLNDLSQRIQLLKKEMVIIKDRSKVQTDEQKEKINAALAEIVDDTSQLAELRKNALYAVLEKIDIHEEIVRFASHLDAFEGILMQKEDEKGKQLDFTLQELAREINTITAKCNDGIISKHAINVKVEIEKAREQAQNIV